MDYINKKRKKGKLRGKTIKGSRRRLRLRLRRKINGRTFPKIHPTNFWISDDHHQYSKICPGMDELLWIEHRLKYAVVERRPVPGHERMPDFRRGSWDGWATYVVFDTTDQLSRSENYMFTQFVYGKQFDI